MLGGGSLPIPFFILPHSAPSDCSDAHQACEIRVGRLSESGRAPRETAKAIHGTSQQAPAARPAAAE
jgi:hypothetical protein